jgi:hypothetical protein
MKKLFLLSGLFMLLGFAKLSAQALPDCSNNNGLEGRISGIVSSGYSEISRSLSYVNYFVAPTPPYVTAILEVTFVGPYCGPACTPIIRTETFEAVVQNNNGNCVWKLGNN